MSGPHEILLLAAGLGAGLFGSIIGLASLVSYPALLAVGLGPVTASVTNTVALVFSSVGSVSGSLPDLTGQAARVRRLAGVGLLGGATGGVLLLLTPSDAFSRIVPWLIAAAGLGVLVRRRPAALVLPAGTHNAGTHDAGTHNADTHDADSHDAGDRDAAAHDVSPVALPGPVADPGWLTPAVFAVSIYGGYFGAASGVLILALLLVATGESVPRASGLKNVVLGVANGVAAVWFVIDGPVRWAAVLPMALGCYIGGRMGPAVVRRAPPDRLRVVIFVAALGLAIKLAFDAY